MLRFPAECDVQMRNHWFYSDHDEHMVKSLDELLGLYYLSIDRGANLLLNIGPNREGLLPRKDKKHLLALGSEVMRRFSHPIASFDHCVLENGTWYYEAEQSHLLDHIVIEEDLTLGESVESFVIRVVTAHSAAEVTVYEGRNIGHKAIIRLPAVKIRGVILDITESEGEPAIRCLSLHYAGDATGL
ncbi:alpha-L-fucosidase [Paenibacillus sp. LHD-117]|uniref:alpha-L-fucosidase n=1 Tax=Paenibacillus sp. LHD-117 TaxID=3071412 RepID=UPI0027DEC039|nr:alpha-L-fucosidase [Paenibacillus sp. LHD-117]MDQ6421871.1 alpha-L-fucosidase [Paenibacillus sp. LHD-117]